METIKTKYLNEDINETIDKTNESYLNHKLANIFEEHDTENNDIDNKSSTSKKRKTRIDHAGSSTTTLKPTTMRGTPIISSTSKTIPRGFYVTKGDIEMTTTMHPITEISMDNIDSNITYNETIVSTEVIDAENISMTDLSKDNETTDMTTFADTDKEYSEYSNIITKFEQTTPLTMTENITQELKQNDQILFVVNNISSDTSKRERVKYSDVTTSLYRPQTSLITETTVSNILKTTEINKNSETNTTSINYTLPIDSVNTEFDITMRSTISTLDTDTSKLPNDGSLKKDIIQLENFSTTISNIPSAKVTNDQSNIHYIVSGKTNEFVSTDHTLEQETTTIKSSLTTANFKRTLEEITADRERDGIKMTNIETTTMIAENKNAILNDFDTVTTREELRDTTVDDKNVYKSNPNFQKVTTLSESTEVPFTTLSNLLPSQIPLTIQSRQEENIHPRRRRPTIFALNNQFGQRRRPNLERRVTQQYEIGDQPSIREDLNSPKRVLVYRKRQRRPNNTTVANNTVSNDEVKTEVTKNKTRRSKLVIKRLKINRKEYVEEDSVPLEKTNIFQDSPLVTEYTERPVDEGTISKSTGSSSSRTPGTILANRIRKPNTSSQSSFLSTSKHPGTVLLGDNRKSRPSDETTLSPTTTIVDAFDDPTVKPELLSIKDEDERAEISDQNGRAQELAVTLAEPPTSQSSSSTGRLPLKDTLRRRISTTVAPRTDSPRTSPTSLRFSTIPKTRQKVTTKTTTSRTTTRTRKDGTSRNSTNRPRRPPIIDYDYYEDEDTPIVEKAMYNGKLFLTSNGTIRCLDQGNFPHPSSCKKFITCAKMVNGLIIGAEYTCPDKLSFDPVGGICNWSAGLGCKE